MTSLFANSRTASLGPSTWPFQSLQNKEQITKLPSKKMSRSFYVESLILNRPTPIDRSHVEAVVASSLHQAKKRMGCFSPHHHSTVDSCSLCPREQSLTSCATRLPPLPTSSIFSTLSLPIPHSTPSLYTTAVPHGTQTHGPFLDHRRIDNGSGLFKDRHHLVQRTSPVGLTTSHITRDSTPPSPPSHLKYRSSMDPRRLSPYLPMGKSCLSVYPETLENFVGERF